MCFNSVAEKNCHLDITLLVPQCISSTTDALHNGITTDRCTTVARHTKNHLPSAELEPGATQYDANALTYYATQDQTRNLVFVLIRSAIVVRFQHVTAVIPS